MTSTDPSIINRSVEKAHVWLDDVAAELASESREDAYEALRAVLHVLRDRLSIDEAAQLAAQLPTLIRGIYYEGWDPSSTPRSYDSAHDFLAAVAGGLPGAADTQASFAVDAVSRVLHRRISAGELEDIMAVLPAGIRPLLSAR